MGTQYHLNTTPRTVNKVYSRGRMTSKKKTKLIFPSVDYQDEPNSHPDDQMHMTLDEIVKDKDSLDNPSNDSDKSKSHRLNHHERIQPKMILSGSIKDFRKLEHSASSETNINVSLQYRDIYDTNFERSNEEAKKISLSRSREELPH